MGTATEHAQVNGPARRRPVAVLVVGAIFLALGCLDLWRGLAPLFGRAGPARLAGDDALVTAIGVAALVGGGFLLAGRNWARWLLVAWMALHVGISLGDPVKLLMHVLIFGLLGFLLFRRPTAAYFRGSA